MILPEIELARGEQVVYIPDHANGNIDHPDCEYGFVTRDLGEDAFVRYFSKHAISQLRTKANSERTPKRLLVRLGHHSEALIQYLLDLYCGD